MTIQNLAYSRARKKANLFFWATAFFALLPFLILSFFSHAGEDDYLYDTLYKNNNFWEAQPYIKIATGRFFANFLMAACVKMNFVSNSYFLHPLLLFLFTAIAIFFLVNTVNKILLGSFLSRDRILQVSFIFLLLNIYVVADIACSFYWFSSAITYQAPIILFILLMALMVIRFKGNTKRKMLFDGLIFITIILMMGCNEPMTVAIATLLLLAVIVAYRFQFSGKKALLSYFCVALLTGIMIVTFSGILSRQNSFNSSTRYISILPIIAFRTLMVFYHIFKEPLFWISFVFCFGAGAGHATYSSSNYWPSFFKKPKIIYQSLALLLAIVVTILTPVLFVTKGSFADRAMSSLILIATFYLLILAFIVGHLIEPAAVNKIKGAISPFIGATALSLTMILSVTYFTAWKSVCSGFFYHEVMEERDQKLANAKKNNLTEITFTSYNEAVRKKIQETFPNNFKSLSTLLEEPPVTIYFFNEAENPAQNGHYMSYYGLKRIIIQTDNP